VEKARRWDSAWYRLETARFPGDLRVCFGEMNNSVYTFNRELNDTTMPRGQETRERWW
jgi:hypothetical protein